MLIKYLIIAAIITVFFRTFLKPRVTTQKSSHNGKNDSNSIDAEYTVVED